MIKLKFKNKDKELEFFKSIEKLNYLLDDAGIRYAMMVSDNDDDNKIGIDLFKLNGDAIEV